MKRLALLMGWTGVLVCWALGSVAFSDSITRFSFTQPNFTGGGGSSFFDVAVVEERGGGKYLRLQKENLELAVQGDSLDVERKKIGLENDKLILEKNKAASVTPAGSSQSGTTAAQNVYYVEKMYENQITGEMLYFTNDGEVYRYVNEKNDHKEVTSVDIDNTGNLTYNQDGVTKTIEAGEYNDTSIAYGTGNVEQNPSSIMNVLIESGN